MSVKKGHTSCWRSMKTIAEYINAAPKEGQKNLRELYAILKTTPSVMKAFKKELAKYKTGKGSISFPYDKPLPKALIRKMAELRVKELREKDVRWM